MTAEDSAATQDEILRCAIIAAALHTDASPDQAVLTCFDFRLVSANAQRDVQTLRLHTYCEEQTMAAIGGFPGQDNTHELNVYTDARQWATEGTEYPYRGERPSGKGAQAGMILDYAAEHGAEVRTFDAKVDNPTTAARVDTTGWNLDYLATHLTNVSFDASQGNNRPLTADEVDALSGTDAGLPDDGEDDWWTSDLEVAAAADRLGSIVAEAVYQRDLGEALAALHDDRLLTGPQRAAYEQYIAGHGC